MPPAHTFFCKSKMLLLKRNNGNNGNKSLFHSNQLTANFVDSFYNTLALFGTGFLNAIGIMAQLMLIDARGPADGSDGGVRRAHLQQCSSIQMIL